MFLEEKQQGEVTTKLKLSEAIRKGCVDTLPIRCGMFFRWHDGGSCCAVGAALVGFVGNVEQAHKLWINNGGITVALQAFGITPELQTLASGRYESGIESREQVADWLETQGY